MEKDAVKKHVESCDTHKEDIRLRKLADMRVEGYMQDVLDTTPIARGMKKIISPNDKTSMTIKFNTAYRGVETNQKLGGGLNIRAPFPPEMPFPAIWALNLEFILIAKMS